ncbi:sulfite exporter TauE/SafE family protein [Arthrobacter crusticola]|uniref:Probable membrane transporter protein n=1 Tax=Arthrobacter crusticola TaxID=2547960 RepID=A0A4R5U3M8_9MICC|nr:sulfite exporter TauE/SafE family protein [Arthrobacter crusticola]TDK28172.1 sulfite exporter TauE/SafE family protein [Arthrobacter crusticola]
MSGVKESAQPAPRAAGTGFWIALIGVGVVGGLLSGLFAIGGGIIMVPLLMALADFDQRRAAATSLAAIVPASVVGSATYLLAGEIDLLAGFFIAIGGIAGALLGSALLKRLPIVWLRWMFIVFILLVAARMVLVSPVRGESVEFSALVALGYVMLGLVMGILSGLFGIGGGIIVVPALIGIFAISDLIAKGTSLLVMIPTSAIGTGANWRAGTVDVGAGLIVGVAATAASIPGAALALALPARLSGILFGLLLLVVAAQLTLRAIRTSRAARASPSEVTP